MRIAVIAQDFPPSVGGIQTYSLELARHLARKVKELVVVAPRQAGNEVTDADLPFRVMRVVGSDALFPALSWRAQRSLIRSGMRVFFHTHWASAVVPLGLGGISSNGVTCIAAHGRELLLRPWARAAWAQSGYDHLRCRVLRRAQCVFAVSRYTAGLVADLGVDGARVEVISNGTDPLRFYPQDASSLVRRLGWGGRGRFPILVTVCRLVPRKGVDRTIEALPRILARHAGTKLVVVGDGPDRCRLEGLVDRTGIRDAVRFVGRVGNDELPLWYSLGDVVVMPSRLDPPDVEGFGIAFLEASACERPVVGPDRGGPRDAIIPGETGLIVDPDSPEAIANAVNTLLDSPEMAREMGKRGRAHVVSELSWEHVAERMLQRLQHASK